MDHLLLTHTSHLWLFTLMVLGIIAVPGMNVAYVVASALAGGRKLGLAAVAGIVGGGMLHVAMAMLGLGLLLTLYPTDRKFNRMSPSMARVWGFGTRSTQVV